MLKLLIVDDEMGIREVVKEYADVMGYHCDEAENGKQAVEKVLSNRYDCILLDIMMPVMDGFTALKKIREHSDVSIIMLSARKEEEDKLSSFEMGIDDYVTKPFSPKELMARIKAVSDRHRKNDSERFELDGLVVDIAGRTLSIEGQRVLVTPKELDLLIYLIDNRNIALSREKILETLWGFDYDGDDRTVDTHIKMLRNSLGPYKDHVVTVRGMGYKFEI